MLSRPSCSPGTCSNAAVSWGRSVVAAAQLRQSAGTAGVDRTHPVAAGCARRQTSGAAPDGCAPVRPRRWRGGHERAASADGRRDRGLRAVGRRVRRWAVRLVPAWRGPVLRLGVRAEPREPRRRRLDIEAAAPGRTSAAWKGDLGDVLGYDRSFRRRSSHPAASGGLPCPRPARRAILRYLALIVAWQLALSDHKSPLRILRRQRRRITDTSSYSRRLGVSKVRTSSSFLAGVAAT